MNRGIKTIGIFLSLMLISELLMVIAISYPYLNLPFGIQRTEFLKNSLSNAYFCQYLFWTALVFTVLLLIFILILLFYPKVKRTFVLKEGKGRLSLEKKVIEGFVRLKIENAGFVSSPDVKVRATKKRIKVKVKGQLNRISNHVEKTEVLMNEIQNELQEILGRGEKVKVDVTYKSFAKEEEKYTLNRSRVE